MDIAKIVSLLKNSGLQNITVGNGVIEFDDPACIYTIFDNILNFGWIVILILTAMMLFGWGVLYIKNGVKINDLFNNAKAILLIFCILSAVKPIVNVIYGDNLFARNCERKSVSLSEVQKLISIRNTTLDNENSLYEVFDMVDSGIEGHERLIIDKSSEEDLYEESESASAQSLGTGNGQNTNVYYTSSYNGSSAYSTSMFPQNLTNGKRIVKVMYAPNTTIYVDVNGVQTKRTGGSPSWRNNNPGNIRKSGNSQYLGAVGTTEAWAVFQSEEEGLNAIKKLLHTKGYRNLSIRDAIHRWAPFGDGNNNPNSYSRRLAKITGLPTSRIVNSLNDAELNKVANAIKIIEGWDPGKEEKL